MDFLTLANAIRDAKLDDDEQGAGPAAPLPPGPPQDLPPTPMSRPIADDGPAPAATPPRPRGFGAGLDDDALKQAQQQGAMASWRANNLRIGDTIARAFSATGSDGEMAKALEGQGKQGVDNILARRKALAENQGYVRSQEQDAREQQKDDASSPQSKAARELVKQALPGVAASLGPAFEQMSHRQITENFPFMKELIDSRAKKQKSSMDEAELGALRKQATALYPDVDFSQLGADSIKNILQYASKHEQQVQTTDRADKSAGLRRSGQEETRRHNSASEGLGERRLGLGEQKQGFKVSQSDVEGFASVDPEHPKALTTKQAEDLAAQSSAVEKVHRLGGEMKEILEKNGGRLLNPASTDLKLFRQKLTEMLPALVTAGGYGNFTVAHQGLAHELLDDPQKLSNLLSTGRLPTEIDSLVRGADQAIDSSAKSVGRRRMKPGEKPEQSKFAPPLPESTGPSGNGAPASAPKLDAEHQKAVDWAKAHPDDPRSTAILKLNGLAQ